MKEKEKKRVKSVAVHLWSQLLRKLMSKERCEPGSIARLPYKENRRDRVGKKEARGENASLIRVHLFLPVYQHTPLPLSCPQARMLLSGHLYFSAAFSNMGHHAGQSGTSH